MTSAKLILGDDEELARLARLLEGLHSLRAAMGSEVREEAWAIAIGLRDIERSTERIFAQIVPALLATTDEREATNALGALGEEYRHLLFHLTHSRHFGHLRDSVEG